jgi:hypothetical protein
MTAEPRYKSPDAARNAVTDRLKRATKDSPWTLGDLQRQYAYDRLLRRHEGLGRVQGRHHR